MDWQQMVALIIVAGTAVLLLASKLRKRKFSFERATHCGCSALPKTSPHSSIVYRARKGERAEVRVKI